MTDFNQSKFDLSFSLNDMDDRDKTRCYVPKRYILTALSFIGMLNVYAMRVNLSVAMVAMVNITKDDQMNHTFVECSNLLPRNQSTGKEKYVGEQYNWGAEEQGLILGAFFYGYVITQLPGGYFSEKFGAKWLFGGGVMVTAVLSLLTPVAASWGVIPFIVVRVLEGLGEGVTFPSMNTLISRWSPKLERSRLSTIIFTGAQIGNVVSMPVSGWLSSSPVLGGWPSAFYVFGTISCIWFVFWIFLVYDTPFTHPSISKNELSYYETNNEEPSKKGTRTPWKQMFTSLPMWALMVAHFGHNLGFLIFLTELPTYLSTILHFNVTDNGMLSALPYIVQAASAWVASYIADKLRKSNVLDITTIRKISNSIGLLGPAICLLGVTVSGCRPQLIVGLFCLAMALNGFVYSGFNVTHVDMSPAFAGTMYAITNTVANFCGVIGPGIVGAFTNSGITIAHWSSVFYITAATYAVGAIVFALFGSAELQPWGDGEDIPLKESPMKEHIDDVDNIDKS